MTAGRFGDVENIQKEFSTQISVAFSDTLPWFCFGVGFGVIPMDPQSVVYSMCLRRLCWSSDSTSKLSFTAAC